VSSEICVLLSNSARLTPFCFSAAFWRNVSVALFDNRWDGTCERSLMAICLPQSQLLMKFSLRCNEENVLQAVLLRQDSAISVTSLRITRSNVWDLLVLKPDHQLAVFTHDNHELPIRIDHVCDEDRNIQMDANLPACTVDHGKIISVQAGPSFAVTAVFEDGWRALTTINLVPQDILTSKCLQILALTLPSDFFFSLHRLFLEQWSSRSLSTSDGVEFDCFTDSLYSVFDLDTEVATLSSNYWPMLGSSASHNRFREDPVLQGLKVPPNPSILVVRKQSSRKPHKFLAAVLYALHTLGENLRLMVHHYKSLVELAPVLCRIALAIRPEWADYWKRLCPDATEGWPSPQDARKLSFPYDSIYSSNYIVSQGRL
jgi:anaphase-promoting complex subunit 1